MKCAHPRQRGAVLVEFTLSFVVFWVFMIGLIDLARTLLTWNAAQEVTLMAARYASVCDNNASQRDWIMNKKEMRNLVMAMGQVDLTTRTDDWLLFNNLPSGCTDATCEQVQVRLNDVRLSLMLSVVPGFPAEVALPDFRVTVMREAMRNSVVASTNPDC